MNNHSEQYEPLLSQGQALLEMNRLEEAKGIFTQACQLNPDDVQGWFALSTVNGRLGEVEASAECCRRVLSLDPGHSEAHLNLGNVYLSQGKHAEAETQYKKVLQSNPGHYGASYGLGNIYYAMGKYEAAAEQYQAAIQINPNLFFAYANLGHLRVQQKAYDKAVNNYLQATRLNPNDAALRNGLGLALLNLGKDEEALSCFEDAVRLNPDYADALINSGVVLSGLGRYDEALEYYQRAQHLSPAMPELYNNVGTVYLGQGRVGEAIDCYQKALEINPQYIAALNNLGKACRFLGRMDSYIEHYRKAEALLADMSEARGAFIENIGAGTPATYDPWLDDELKKCFSVRDVNFTSIATFTALHLKHKYEIYPPLVDDADAIVDRIPQLGGDQLFLMFLHNTINSDPDMENLLREIRRVLLDKYWRTGSLTPEEAALAYALACQCLNNEYVFAVAEEEEAQAAELKQVIEERIASQQSPDVDLERSLVVYAMYDRLYSLGGRERLNAMARSGWSEKFRLLVEQGLTDALEEERIKQEIQTLGDMEDKTTRLVQSHYEENPYPRWISLPQLKKRSIKRVLKQMFPHYTFPPFLDGPVQLLVAGCGTGQHPIISSLSFDNVEILAVDISKSSLAYAIRMARKFGINNIRFMQGDLLELPRLKQRFHIIECIGVLVCVEDPLAGWKALTGLLEKDGLMLIGLYSEKARQKVVDARRIIADENLTSTRTNIRNLRKRILKRELGDHLYGITSSKDFYSTSGCRDLIFHSTEHRFTLPQINGLLNELDLEFIGFELDNNAVKSRYQEMFPEDREMTNLLLWDQYEEMYPHTFSKLYNFWCRKKD